MSEYDSVRQKALKKLPGRNGLEKALKVVDVAIEKGGESVAPLPLLLARLELFVEAGERGQALEYARNVFKERAKPAERKKLLARIMPLMEEAPSADSVLFVWKSWASLGEAPRCWLAGRHFASLPEAARTKFREDCRGWLRKPGAENVGHLGIAHLAVAEDELEKAVSHLNELAKSAADGATVPHASDLIEDLPPGEEARILWETAEIHLLADQPSRANPHLMEFLARYPDQAVDRLEASIKSSLIDPGEAADLVTEALPQAPNSRPLRWFLNRRSRERADWFEAGLHVLTMSRTATTPEELDQHLAELDELLDHDGNDLGIRCMRTEICCLMGSAKPFEEGVRDILVDAPDIALRILELWSETGQDRLPALEILHGTALASLLRHEEAVFAFTRLFEKEGMAAELVESLSRLSRAYPEATTYGLLLVRCLHRSGREEEALRTVEKLLSQPERELERLHDFLAEEEFAEEAAPHALTLRVRCALELSRFEEALGHMETLAASSFELLRSALDDALRWRSEWLADTGWSRRLASLLFRAERVEDAIGVMDEAGAKGAKAARSLAEVFDEPFLSGRRQLPVLLCRFRQLLRAGRLEAAAATAVGVGDMGESEEEHRLLLSLREHKEAKRHVLPPLLTVSLKLDRPVSECLRYARELRLTGESDLEEKAYQRLGSRHSRSSLGPEGLDLVGWLAVDLGRFEEASGHFEELVPLAPLLGKAGLLEIVTRRPEMDEVRARLADLRREGGERDAALELLTGAPERTEPLWTVLEALVGEEPPHLESWRALSRWLLEKGSHEELVDHLYRLAEQPGADLEEVEELLGAVCEAAGATPRPLWLRARLARRRTDTDGEIGVLGEILRHGGDEVGKSLAAVDEIRVKHSGKPELLLADLALSIEGRSPERVIARAREAIDRAGFEAVHAEVESQLEQAEGEKLFASEREFQQARFDLARTTGDAEVAARALGRLLGMDAGAPGKRARNTRLWREKFGADAERLVPEVTALTDLDRAAEAVPRIRELAALDRDGVEFEEARRLADAAVATAPGDPDVLLLASDLAAVAGEASIAREHALSVLTGSTRDRIAGQLLELRERFAEDATFDMALAERVYEPAEAFEKAGDHLGLALDRAPDFCAAALTAAERLVVALPSADPLLSVRARASVLAALKDPKGGERAVGHLRALFEGAPDRAEEALEGLDRVLSVRKESVAGRLLRDELLRALERPAESIVEIRSELLPRILGTETEFEARFRLADALEVVEEFAEALEEWRRCEVLHPDDEEVPRRVRGNFVGRLAAERRDLPEDADVTRGFLALEEGRHEDALAAVPRTPADDEPPDLPRLTIRGIALAGLDRHAQVVEELGDRIGEIDLLGALDVYEKEYLFCVGRSLLLLGEKPRALRCLERLAREAPHHRAVRRMLDRMYRDEALGRTRPLEATLTMEEVDGD